MATEMAAGTGAAITTAEGMEILVRTEIRVGTEMVAGMGTTTGVATEMIKRDNAQRIKQNDQAGPVDLPDLFKTVRISIGLT